MLIEQIRSASLTEHEKLEKTLFPYLTNLKTKRDYRRLLHAFYGYVMPVQELISQHVNEEMMPDISQRRNAALLLQDLVALEDTERPRLCTDLPKINSHEAAMGALYVLEGSTLGGKIIAGMIAEKLGSTEALHFFRGYGEHTGKMWRNFLNILELNHDEKHNRIIVESAGETFTLFERWLKRNLETRD
jgi:heme oxygenase